MWTLVDMVCFRVYSLHMQRATPTIRASDAPPPGPEHTAARGHPARTKGLLAKLGKHKIGKGCLYIKRLADVQMGVLEELIARSVAETRRRYPGETS
jgi:hypothetical protein